MQTATPPSDPPSPDLTESAVGLFWAIKTGGTPSTVILDHRCPLNVAEPYGDMLTCPHGHYEIWRSWQRNPLQIPAAVRPMILGSEYEEWPRGRIVFDTIGRNFICYGAAKILRPVYLVHQIYLKFGLPSDRTIRKHDLHYRSKMPLTEK